MEQQRSWFRIHLFTALVAMVAASVFLGISLLHENVIEEYPHAETTLRVYAIGWPFPMKMETRVTSTPKQKPEERGYQHAYFGDPPRDVRVPWTYFCAVDELLRMTVEAPENSRMTFSWKCVDPPDLAIPEKYSTNSTLVFVPKTPGFFYFTCACTDIKTETFRVQVIVAPKAPKNPDGWHTRNALLNAAVALACVIALMVLVEWRLRRRA